MAREFEIRREVELPATPEQVWAAVSTAAGLASWLFPMGEEEAHAVGDVVAGHTVTTFDPPHHLAVRAAAPALPAGACAGVGRRSARSNGSIATTQMMPMPMWVARQPSRVMKCSISGGQSVPAT